MIKNREVINLIRTIVYDILDDENVLIGEWHLGSVEEVLSENMLKVFVDGSDVSQRIPSNPDVEFTSGDHVWVHFVNKDSKNKFVTGKRSV
ncbi:hypothetical protein PQ478_08360 [Alkalihalophilus pseudofirmus]|uniref:hypothetical protein n=1 Tax=Alkalihalophilus pseudofirmus TaxID=79885 RepID=UPI00259B6FA3|nr:hypothetical protein [Alkalihalophilus pseudofirmus]WEG18481.1 hypothetical protein PQ478_08360 [Alkalihalophilus pseudofirmus]